MLGIQYAGEADVVVVVVSCLFINTRLHRYKGKQEKTALLGLEDASSRVLFVVQLLIGRVFSLHVTVELHISFVSGETAFPIVD